MEQARIAIAFRIVGGERDRLVEILQCLGVLVAGLVDQAAAEIGGRVIGVERDRALDVGHRNIRAAGSGDRSARGLA
jgi:hypothetical protein